MGVIHFLNVKNGDCSIIRHNSGRTTVIDICNGNAEHEDSVAESVIAAMRYSNYHQKDHPVNPIDYISGILPNSDIFRFILTHPDMDHMDGIKNLFDTFNVINFWDTENKKKIEEGTSFGRYNEEDWKFYQEVRKSGSDEKPFVQHFYNGSKGEFYNKPGKGESSDDGDGLSILGPSKELIDAANKSGDYNESSYVLLYKEYGFKVIFAGDSGEAEWNFILDNYEEDVKNIDVLIAPHHGRKTGGNDEYLKILRPKLTLFGNAKSKDLDYQSWLNLGLEKLTNNEGGSFVLEIMRNKIDVYCTYEKFSKSYNKDSFYNKDFDVWYLKSLEK